MAKKKLTPGKKAARTRKRKTSAKKAVTTRKRRAAGSKAATTRRWNAIRSSAESALAAIESGNLDNAKKHVASVIKNLPKTGE